MVVKIVAGLGRQRKVDQFIVRQRAVTGYFCNQCRRTGASLRRVDIAVLAHVLDGRSNKLIGRALGISHRTVEIHRSRAMAKFGTSSTTELIRWTLMSPGG